MDLDGRLGRGPHLPGTSTFQNRRRMDHPPHPQQPPHGPCCVKERGAITAFRTIRATLLDGTYSCFEPDRGWLQQLFGRR